MERQELADKLSSLMRLDQDAARAYTKAIENLKRRDLRDSLRRFQADHERHAEGYRSMIRAPSAEALEPAADARGVFLEGMTAIQSKIGEWSALKACETGEKYVNYKYDQVANEDFPPDVRSMIESNYADEKRHLSDIQKRLQVAPSRRRGRAIGLGALGLAAGVVIWRQMAARERSHPS